MLLYFNPLTELLLPWKFCQADTEINIMPMLLNVLIQKLMLRLAQNAGIGHQVAKVWFCKS